MKTMMNMTFQNIIEKFQMIPTLKNIINSLKKKIEIRRKIKEKKNSKTPINLIANHNQLNKNDEKIKEIKELNNNNNIHENKSQKKEKEKMKKNKMKKMLKILKIIMFLCLFILNY